MIGQLFSISATNIGHAALREAALPVDSAVDVRLVALAENGDEQVGVLIGREAFRRVIPISETRVRMCIDAEGMCETQRYVDELAGQIRSALHEAQTL